MMSGSPGTGGEDVDLIFLHSLSALSIKVASVEGVGVMVRGRERMGSMSLPSSLFLLLKHIWELQGPFMNDVSKEGKGLAKF